MSDQFRKRPSGFATGRDPTAWDWFHHAKLLLSISRSGERSLLRQRGLTYREVEDAGHYLVIIDIGCKFKTAGAL